jgi:16S rRNA (adenine1518-N6/adenine1519-N6)-dimethyltransferase
MIAPRKRFGQHFLNDQIVIDKIIAHFTPTSNEHVVEIGPGQGALTLPLLKRIGTLEAVELDRDLIESLKERARTIGDLQVHSADALSFDFASLKQDERLLRIIGNLPYNISTPLLFHLLDHHDIIQDMVVMLQKEVADRLAAKANSQAYGRLSVMMQYHCKVELLFDVAPHSFYPPPKVQSSIVRLTPYREYPHVAKNYDLFAEIVKHAFGQRRKTLRNSLSKIIDATTWEKIKTVSQTQRPEAITVKDFVDLSNIVYDSKKNQK